MKNNLSIILSAVALVAVIVFGALLLSGGNKGEKTVAQTSDTTAVAAEGSIVYIDLDRIFISAE